VPRNAELVRHYKHLGDYLHRFIAGNIHLLILIGPRGTGKSRAVETVLKTFPIRSHHQNCPGTGWSFYLMLVAQMHMDVIVLNEAGALFRDNRAKDLVKTVTELEKDIRVQWGFSCPVEIRKGEIPSTFVLRSRFIFIANSWDLNDADMQAIASRATLVYLNPPAREMHEYAGRWFKGRQDVYDFMGKHLAECEEPDLRYYELANQRAEWAREREYPDSYWQDYVIRLGFVGDKKIVWQLMNDKTFPSTGKLGQGARAKEFVRLAGYANDSSGERQYYRLYHELVSRMDDEDTQPSNDVKLSLV